MPTILASKNIQIALGLGVAAVVAFGMIFSAILSSSRSDHQKLVIATRWLDEGRWDLAHSATQEIETHDDPSSDSTWHYIQGVARLMPIIEDLDSYEHRAALYEITEDLKISQKLGYPVSQRSKGNYYLGVCLYNTYRWDEAIEALNSSIIDFAQTRSESLRMIFSSHLRKPKPDPDAAESVLERWANMPGLSKRELAQTRLARAQLAIHHKQFAQARHWLSQIEPGASEYYEALEWKAQSLIAQATGRNARNATPSALLSEAKSTLQRLSLASETPNEIRRRAVYLLGKVHRYSGQLDDAVGTLSSIRQQSPFSAEAIAASLEEAEILLEMGMPHEVTATTKHLLSGIRDIRLYNGYWVPATELYTRVISIADKLKDLGLYELALDIAGQLQIAFPAGHALQLQANILASWGQTVEKSSIGDSSAMATVYNLFARAANKFEQLASADVSSKDYLEFIWNAIENYQRAGHIDSANRLIKTYLQYENRSKRPRALLALARNNIARGNWQASLVPLDQCFIEHPYNPNGYEARLLAAQAHKELNDLDQAIELLSANLWDSDLHPDNPLWKESFMELGSLQFLRGERELAKLQQLPDSPWEDVAPILQRSFDNFTQAIETLSETVRRYPTDARTKFARYRLARSFQLASQFPDQSAQRDESLSEPSRHELKQQRIDLLDQAARQYGELLQAITIEEKPVLASKTDPLILQNAYFGRADILMQFGRYDEAIAAYREAVVHYTNRPESLEALVQIVQCQRKLKQDAEATKTIHQAELMLERIPAERDANFVSTTRGDRDYWHQVLGRLKQWN